MPAFEVLWLLAAVPKDGPSRCLRKWHMSSFLSVGVSVGHGKSLSKVQYFLGTWLALTFLETHAMIDLPPSPSQPTVTRLKLQGPCGPHSLQHLRKAAS